MGSPLVRRDEFDAELAKLRKVNRAGKAKASGPDGFVTRAELGEFIALVDERFLRIEAALDLAPYEDSAAAAAADAGDGEATEPAAVPTPLEVAEGAEGAGEEPVE